MYLRRVALTAAVLLVAAATVRLAPGTASTSEAEEEEERPATTARRDTIGPSLEEARKLIVGTWIQDTDGSIDGTKKGPKKRVFTEDGTLRRYRRNDSGTYQLQETVQYALVDENPHTDQKASEAGSFIAYLKTTEPDGDVNYNVLTNVNREADPPYLSIQYIGGASTTDVLYSPPSAFN